MEGAQKSQRRRESQASQQISVEIDGDLSSVS